MQARAIFHKPSANVKIVGDFLLSGKNNIHLEVHDGIKKFEDGVKDVGVKGTLIVNCLGCRPLFGLLVEEVLTPQPIK